MTSPEQGFKSKIIHLGLVYINGKQLVVLRQISPNKFQWFLADKNLDESPTEVSADSVQESMRLAFREWKLYYFRPINCGFRYTLPERDEHGINALFHQMVASLSTANGIYFDEELGHTCYVQNSSSEARNFWKKFSLAGKM